jgi:hypothetical protein
MELFGGFGFAEKFVEQSSNNSASFALVFRFSELKFGDE